MYFPFLAITPTAKPSSNQPESKKDKKYHVDKARHYIGRLNTEAINDFRLHYYTNQEFFRGKWGMKEDVETFLMDGKYSNQRTALSRNIVSPMVNRLKGSAKAMSISASPQIRTQYAKTRYEEGLAEAVLMSRAAATSPVMAAAISSEREVSPNMEQTVAAFENSYQDAYVTGMNSLLTMLADINKFENMKLEQAERLALSGLVASHARMRGTRIEWEMVNPNEVLWDTLANYSDWSDAEFVAMCPLMDIASIGETFDIDEDQLRALESSMNSLNPYGTQNRNSYPEGKPRVFTVYWKDVKWIEKGYVDIEGEPTLITLGEEYAITGKTYTESDLIAPPDDPINQRGFDGRKKMRRALELIRSCTFIPKEYMGAKPLRGQDYTVADQVLDWGVYPIQDPDPSDSSFVSFPLKLSAWAYTDGYVSAPINDVIDPQRFINRTHSNIDWLLSKSGGKSIIYDPKSIDATHMDETQVLAAFKNSDPVALDGAINGGLNNSVYAYDQTPGPGLMNLFNMVGLAVQDANSATGINEAAQGQSSGPDQRNGVTSMLLQQTGIILTPFYEALWRLFEQMHQLNAQVGKSFYSRYPNRLRQLVGDDDAAVIIASKDVAYETFRVSIIRDIDISARMKQANDTIYGLLQMGLLDPQTAANLLGRATEDEVYAATRKAQGDMAQAAQQQQKAQAEAMQMQGLAAQEANIQQQQQSVYEDAMRAAENDSKLKSKNAQPFMQKQAEAMFPEQE